MIQNNRLLETPSGLARVWEGHVDDERQMDGTYRPVFLTAVSVVGRLSDFKPWALRLLSLFLHALNALGLFLLAKQLFKFSEAQAWIAGLVFLLHPVHTTNIALVWKQSDLWVAAAALASLLALLRAGETGRGAWLWPAFLCFLFALGVKESSLILPALWIAAEPLMPSGGRRRRFALTGGAVIFSLVYYFLLWPKIPGPLQVDGNPQTRWEYFLTQLTVFPKYALALIAPSRLTIDRTVFPVPSLTPALSLGLGATALALLTLLYLVFRKRNKAAVALLAGVVWLIPTSSFQPLALPYDETRLYLVVGTLVIALISGSSALPWKVPARPPFRKALLAGVVILLGTQTLRQAERWQSDDRLWQAAVAVDPTSARAHYQLGLLADGRRQWDQAEAEYRLALRTSPTMASATLNLGILLGRKGQLAAAEEEFRRLLACPPFWAARGHYHLALGAMYRGDFRKAAQEMEQAGTLSPKTGIAIRGKAVLADRMGKRAEALTLWKRYLADYPLSREQKLAAESEIARLAAIEDVR